MSTIQTQKSSKSDTVSFPSFQPKRSITKLLDPLDEIAEKSPRFLSKSTGHFESDHRGYSLPHYVFLGPRGGDEPIRIGIFAGIHGDEQEGVLALAQFLRLLHLKPEWAAGYCLFIYPVCNPTGFEDNTRHSRSGKDLNREFWSNSSEPEVLLLQKELIAHSFHGIISLHTDDTSEGFYGFAHGATLTKNLIEPALDAAAQFVPRNNNDVIDGFKARNGVIRKGYQGILGAPPQVRPRPFEIILETPKTAPEYLKEAAFVSSLKTILSEYRKFIAYAQNL
ncbi:MAG: succinylglutamate desuccinylase/aspartoacylase family protein [Verrucomicrobiota bacterium]